MMSIVVYPTVLAECYRLDRLRLNRPDFDAHLLSREGRALTPSVGHAESRKIGGGSEMIDTDGKEKLSRRVQAGRGGAVPRH